MAPDDLDPGAIEGGLLKRRLKVFYTPHLHAGFPTRGCLTDLLDPGFLQVLTHFFAFLASGT